MKFEMIVVKTFCPLRDMVRDFTYRTFFFLGVSSEWIVFFI